MAEQKKKAVKKAKKAAPKKEAPAEAVPKAEAPVKGRKPKATPAKPGAAKGFTTHGRTFTGVVVSDRMHRTVTVQWERRHFVPKFQRYERRYSKVKAHNPDEIDAKKGDTVTIIETKPISKTKNFVVIKKN